jgi:hypothetical protein
MVDAGERDNTIIVSLFPSAALTRGSGRMRVRVGEVSVRPVPASVEDENWPSFGSTAFPDLRHFCETAIAKLSEIDLGCVDLIDLFRVGSKDQSLH